MKENSELADDANTKRKDIVRLYPGSTQVWVDSGRYSARKAGCGYFCYPSGIALKIIKYLREVLRRFRYLIARLIPILSGIVSCR